MTPAMVTNKYFNWFKDSEIKKYIDFLPENIGELKKQVDLLSKNKNILFWGIFKKKKHIGNLKIFEVNKKKNIARFGILIGDKEFRNKGVGFEVIEAIKNSLIKKKIYKLWLGVDKKNFRAIATYKKVGFIKYKDEKKYFYMLCNLFRSKIILGGAQFNSNYGITNFSKRKQTVKELKQLLNFCKTLNINHIDAAEAYDFFKNYKKKLPKNTKIDTKISLKQIHSFKELKKKLLNKYIKKNIYIDTLLIHDGDDILKKNEFNKIKILHRLKKKKIISKIGVSIYNFKILKKIILKLNIDVVQIPYNIVDKRIEKFKKILKSKKILVYARSIFLQGSLLKKVDNIEQLKNIYVKVKKQGKKFNQSNLEICLNFAFSNDLIDKIIIGVRNLREMKLLMRCKIIPKKYNIKFNKSEISFAQQPNKWNN